MCKHTPHRIMDCILQRALAHVRKLAVQTYGSFKLEMPSATQGRSTLRLPRHVLHVGQNG